jgi:hypothetical protein
MAVLGPGGIDRGCLLFQSSFAVSKNLQGAL